MFTKAQLSKLVGALRAVVFSDADTAQSLKQNILAKFSSARRPVRRPTTVWQPSKRPPKP